MPDLAEILIDLARRARGGTPAEVLPAVAAAIQRSTCFKEVVVNVYRPAFDEYVADVVTGSGDARAAIQGRTVTAEALAYLLRDVEEPLPGVFFLPAEMGRMADMANAYMPAYEPLDGPNAWQAEDALIVMLQDSADVPLGFLSIDEPETGERPGIPELRRVRAIASLAEEALEISRSIMQRRHVEVLGQALLETSVRLPRCQTLAEVHDMLNDVGLEHTGFERLSVYTDDGAGSLWLGHTFGWPPEEREVLLPETLSSADAKRVLTPDREQDGAWLIESRELFSEVPGHVRAHRKGRGPYGWGEQCLVIQTRVGVLGVPTLQILEEPRDHAQPSPLTRRVIRIMTEMFASANVALEQRDALSRMATHDPLTGLRNRRGLNELIESHRSVSVLICDLDHFKSVNDRYGHGMGDRVLQRFGELLRSQARGTDVAIRLGGEEFCLVLPQTDRQGAIDAAERLRVAVQEGLTDLIPDGVTVSIGVATTTTGTLDARDLLATADLELYSAKQAGRNRVGG